MNPDCVEFVALWSASDIAEKLGKDKFEVAEDGSVVYVDEFSRMTIEEAVQKKLAANDRTKWVILNMC